MKTTLFSFWTSILLSFVGLMSFFFSSLAKGKEPQAENVAVIYNADIPQSVQLAQTYAKCRKIPQENLVGLHCSDKETISREEFVTSIETPLRQRAKTQHWWNFSERASLSISQRKIYIFALIKGLPLRIANDPEKSAHPNKHINQPKAMLQVNSACVDSELALLPIPTYPIEGLIFNPYFDKINNICDVNIPLVLISRIDAPRWETCYSLIYDSLTAEKEGLSGWAAVDIAQFYKQGDDWLRHIIVKNQKQGIPTLIDLHPQTLPTEYPLPYNIAFYYGWYTNSVNGPFTDSNFHFQRGAIACHIHSFSASTLRNPKVGWTAPLIERGAAVSVGNIDEPYLEYTHHLDILHDRLLNGYCVAEAASMSIPSYSWHGVVIGDPLYRPFPYSRIDSPTTPEEKAGAAWAIAIKKWGQNPDKLLQLSQEASKRMRLPTLPEAMGNYFLFQKDYKSAHKAFLSALPYAQSKTEELRLNLSLVSSLRYANEKKQALSLLQSLENKFLTQKGIKAVQSWINILDPKPPTDKNSPSNSVKVQKK